MGVCGGVGFWWFRVGGDLVVVLRFKVGGFIILGLDVAGGFGITGFGWV